MEYVLNMPAVSFWAMLKQMQKAKAVEAIERLDFAVIPRQDFSYYEQRRDAYLRIIHQDKVEELPVKPKTDEALSWNDPVAQAMLLNVFREHRKSKYGR
jgi:hypothetical protein